MFGKTIKEAKKNKGYTLVEVSIVIALIAILSSLLVVNLQPGRTQEQVKSAQDEVASAIKLAQSFALQGRKNSSGNVPKCYGMTKNGAGYMIYWTNSSNCSGTKNSVEQYNFSNGVSVGDFDFGFDVPHGKVVVGGGTSVTIHKNGTTDRNVTLDQGGAITKN